jgi:hypothetical protein
MPPEEQRQIEIRGRREEEKTAIEALQPAPFAVLAAITARLRNAPLPGFFTMLPPCYVSQRQQTAGDMNITVHLMHRQSPRTETEGESEQNH